MSSRHRWTLTVRAESADTVGIWWENWIIFIAIGFAVKRRFTVQTKITKKNEVCIRIGARELCFVCYNNPFGINYQLWSGWKKWLKTKSIAVTLGEQKNSCHDKISYFNSNQWKTRKPLRKLFPLFIFIDCRIPNCTIVGFSQFNKSNCPSSTHAIHRFFSNIKSIINRQLLYGPQRPKSTLHNTCTLNGIDSLWCVCTTLRLRRTLECVCNSYALTFGRAQWIYFFRKKNIFVYYM